MDEALPLPKPLSLNIEEIRRRKPDTEDFVSDLYVKLRPSLIFYVYHLVGSTRDAEDVVQVAFLQLFDQLTSDVEIKNIRGWLYRVAHNVAIDAVRTINRRETLFREWFNETQTTEARETPELILINRDQIEKSMGLLNEKEQQCLMLRAEGLTYQEIADVIETTPKSVSVYLARGLKKFESRNEGKKR